jgi:hypothetical protein
MIVALETRSLVPMYVSVAWYAVRPPGQCIVARMFAQSEDMLPTVSLSCLNAAPSIFDTCR